MKGINEQELLPIIRAVVSGNQDKLKNFIETIAPIFNEFIKTGRSRDKYNGWAFDLTFVNESSESDDISPFIEKLSVLSIQFAFTLPLS